MIFPVVLVVTSSILLDFASRYERKWNRCKFQILLWLTLTLLSRLQTQTNNTSSTSDEQIQLLQQQQMNHQLINIQVVFLAWANLTIFSNLLIILTQALQSRFLILVSKQRVLEVLQIFSISSWGSMIVAGFSMFWSSETTSTSIVVLLGLSIWRFMGIFLVLWLSRLYANHRRRISKDFQESFTINSTTANTMHHRGGIISRFCVTPNNNNSSTNPASSFFLDESQWYTWTRMETIQWFTQQLSMTNRDDSNRKYGRKSIELNLYDHELEEERDLVLTVLTPHRITGNCLDGLIEISQLVGLGVPYAAANHLSDSIACLVTKYPNPNSRNKTRNSTKILYNDQNPESYALELHDHEYNSLRSQQVMKNIRRRSHDEELHMHYRNLSESEMELDHQHRHQFDSTVEGGITAEEHHQQLNDVMKKRFGLELPKLKAADFYAATQLAAGKKSNRMSHPLDDMTIDATDTDAGDYVKINQPQSDPTRMHTQHKQSKQTYPSVVSSPSSIPPPYQDASTGGGPSSIDVKLKPQLHLLGNICEEMPPHMREIAQQLAERRPDLIEHIWNQKQEILQGNQKQSEAQATTTLLTSLSAPSRRHVTLHTLPQTGEETTLVEDIIDDGDDNDDEDDNEDETTSLIQRDGDNEVPIIRYKSITKSNSNIV